MVQMQIATSCAWCNQEEGKPQGDGSHGICQSHADAEYEKYKESRQSIPVYGTCGHLAKSPDHDCGCSQYSW